MDINVAVIGGGTWGRALSYAFSQKNNVGIVSRRKLTFLSGHYSRKVEQISLEEALKCKFIIIAIKSEAIRAWLKNVKFNKNSIILIAAKGIEASTGAFIHDMFAEKFSRISAGYIMGPSFAAEVMESMPCALNIHTKSSLVATNAPSLFPSFMKIYINNDIVGGAVGGAYKNVIAIAGGISDGLKLGNNAKASLLARGLVEMCRFGMFFGAKQSTFLGLSGAGDLFLSANSSMSRNYRVGFALAQNRPLKHILNDLGEVAEGIQTSRAILKLAKKHDIYVPIATQVNAILDGKAPKESVEELLS